MNLVMKRSKSSQVKGRILISGEPEVVLAFTMNKSPSFWSQSYAGAVCVCVREL